MKIRNGFVSNSSSSSFVIMNWDLDFYNISPIKYLKNEELNIPQDLKNPEYEYGWDWKIFSRFEEKICWAILQAQYIEGRIPELRETAENFPLHNIIYQALKQELGVNDIYISLGDNKGYIDHQSCSSEDSGQLEIFESVENMKAFLFNTKSYIRTGNDNDDCSSDLGEPEGISIKDTPAKETVKEETITISSSEMNTILRLKSERPEWTAQELMGLVKNNQKKFKKYDEEVKKIKSMSREELEEVTCEYLRSYMWIHPDDLREREEARKS